MTWLCQQVHCSEQNFNLTTSPFPITTAMKVAHFQNLVKLRTEPAIFKECIDYYFAFPFLTRFL